MPIPCFRSEPPRHTSLFIRFELMKVSQFIKNQINQVRQGGAAVLIAKVGKFSGIFLELPFYIFAVPAVLVIRAIKPWLLVRIGFLRSRRIGHFAANTELYLCERDAGINTPAQRHVDIFYMAAKPICNRQLATMWRKALRLWPAWMLAPIYKVNRLIPGGKPHEIGDPTQHDRDVHNLLDRFPPHLRFTPEEEARGEAGLRAMGIPIGAPFVCLAVRDSAYLADLFRNSDLSYHNYRDSDIQNYVLAAETLADRGYFVLRMGAKVNAAMNSVHPRVIDYASNGMRTDFMDIYLGAKCAFCISVGTGFDAIPLIFRRSIAYVNMVPAAYLFTFREQFLGIFKHHFDAQGKRELSFSEIFSRGIGLFMRTSDYDTSGVKLVENTPEEIRDVAVEMAERLAGTWQPHAADQALQRRFWDIFPNKAVDAHHGKPLHGEIRSRFGAVFLRNNQGLLQ